MKDDNHSVTPIISRRQTLQILGAGLVVTPSLVACSEGGGGAPAAKKEAPKKEMAKTEEKEKKPGSQPEKTAAADGEKKGGESGEIACDQSKVDDQSKSMRKTLQYVAKSPKEGKYCKGCAQYIKPEGGAACGGCKLFSGPVNPNGYCLSYAPMQG